MNNKKIGYLMPFPIQYYSPLFEHLTIEGISLKVYYCSNYGTTGKTKVHPVLGEFKTWDTNLLNGYEYVFLKNHSFYSSIHNGFFGAINWGLFNQLRADRPDLLVVGGWRYFTMLYAVVCCKLLGIKVALMGDNSIESDNYVKGLKLSLKRIALGKILFKVVHYIFYIGESNKDFWLKYGIPKHKLWFAPYAVNNQFFQQRCQELKSNTAVVDKQTFTVLFVGRLVSQKRPLELIKAVENIDNIQLIMIGIGPLQDELLKYIEENKIKNVNLVGFKNQTELPAYFASSDLFVLPSGKGETWGLVVNEAMNFGLPVIVSNTTGCSRDLVNGNGYVFETGNIPQLREKILLIKNDEEGRKAMSRKSLEIIKKYSYVTTSEQLQKIMKDL